MSKDRSELSPEADGQSEDVGPPHPELSLKQLSEAYAQVLQEQGATSEGSASSDEGDEQDSPSAAQAETADRRIRQMSLKEVDIADNTPCPVSPASIVEAILFVGAPAGVALSSRKIAAAMRDVSPGEVKKSINKLNQHYEKQNSAFRIVEESGNYSMKLIDELVDVQNYYFGRNRAARLSQSAIDVLAIVAYNQPLSRQEVDKIRCRPSGAVLSQLLRRDLIAGEPSDQQKDKMYRTTGRFLELFGLESITDLPQTSVVSDLEELTDH